MYMAVFWGCRQGGGPNRVVDRVAGVTQRMGSWLPGRASSLVDEAGSLAGFVAFFLRWSSLRTDSGADAVQLVRKP